jgi:hypothetical protein
MSDASVPEARSTVAAIRTIAPSINIGLASVSRVLVTLVVASNPHASAALQRCSQSVGAVRELLSLHASGSPLSIAVRTFSIKHSRLPKS